MLTNRLVRHLAVTAALTASLLPAWGAGSLSERLNSSFLQKCRDGVAQLRKQDRSAPEKSVWTDVRCVLHAHSLLSHDSRGTPEEIAAAAKQAGVRALFMTEHPDKEGRWWAQGHRGEKEGVLFIPGAEISDGLLLWRSGGENWAPDQKSAEILDRVRDTRAVAFIAHPEQRKDEEWELPPFHGMEIYNTHADAADSDYVKTLGTLRGDNPFKMLAMLDLFRKYPIESYAAVFDEQKAVLSRWDRLNAGFLREAGEGRAVRKCVGIAANDAHQNVGIRIVEEDGRLVIQDALGKALGRLPANELGLLFGVKPGQRPGEPRYSRQFDPYPVAFSYVSTHLLTETGPVTEDALFESLLAGRAYVAFDWILDPTGFDFSWVRGARTRPMGSEIDAGRGGQLVVRSPVACELRVLKDGELLESGEGRELTTPVKGAGVYRAEAWVRLAGEPRPWIYSNPLYVR